MRSAERAEVGGRVDVREERLVDLDDGDVELGERGAKGELAREEPPLEHGQGAAAVRARERPRLRDGGVAACARERLQEPGVARGQSTGSTTQSSLRARRRPAATPAIGARVSVRSSVSSNGSGRPSARFPSASRSSHHASVRHARSASDSSPIRASAFGEPKRLLAPPTSRSPVTAGESPGVDAWLDHRAGRARLGVGVPADALEVDASTGTTLLDLARLAAHESGDRRNAPLLAFLVGRASAAGPAGVEELAAAVRRALDETVRP